MGRIVFLETSDIGARYSAEAARRLGFEPFFLCKLSDYHADPLAQLEAYPHADCDTADVESVLSALSSLQSEENPVIAVTSLRDSRIKQACEVARRSGVVGLDPAVLKLKNKAWVARLTPEFSPPTLCFQSGRIPVKEIAELLSASSKIVIKPSEGAGALGVFTLTDPAEVAQLPARIQGLELPASLREGEWLAQAFIAGELFSLEGYVLGGVPAFLGFTSRRRVEFTESAASFPVDRTLAPALRTRAEEAVQALVSRSGMDHGYFHIELIFGENCYLVDANVGRMGGGPMGELLALSFNQEPVSIYEHLLDVSLFGWESRSPYQKAIEAQALPRESFAVLYGLKEGGELKNVEIPQDSRCFHTQLLGPGTKVPPMGVNDWSWVGIVSGLKGETLQTVDQLRIQTSQGVFEAYY